MALKLCWPVAVHCASENHGIQWPPLHPCPRENVEWYQKEHATMFIITYIDYSMGSKLCTLATKDNIPTVQNAMPSWNVLSYLPPPINNTFLQWLVQTPYPCLWWSALKFLAMMTCSHQELGLVPQGRPWFSPTTAYLELAWACLWIGVCVAALTPSAPPILQNIPIEI
jgi:hypothetical protein